MNWLNRLQIIFFSPIVIGTFVLGYTLFYVGASYDNAKLMDVGDHFITKLWAKQESW